MLLDSSVSALIMPRHDDPTIPAGSPHRESGELSAERGVHSTSSETRHIDASPSSKAWLLESGKTVDHFVIDRPIGAGATGEVYLARDTRLGRKVALKLLGTDAPSDATDIRNRLIEARATAAVNHPHIVSIYSVGIFGPTLYLALEYIEGQTLKERIVDARPAARESLRMVRDIASAITEAHRKKIVHRDLKPANVLLAKDGRVRVVDFGLALFAQPRSSDSSRSGTALITSPTSAGVGTPAYMAPEQWLGESVSGASDMWALGVILYELLYGHRPFSAQTQEELRQLVCEHEQHDSLPSIEEVPETVLDLLRGMLHRQPRERPTAPDTVALLEAVQASFLAPPRSGDVNPYRGLLPFAEQHAGSFFGRDDEVDALVEKLREQPILPVVGPSGSGKSSFVQAGAIPRLRETATWALIRLRPGLNPFASLATALTASQVDIGEDIDRIHDHPGLLGVVLREHARIRRCRVLVFVDQLEELYTLVSDESVRRAFMLAISSAADDAALPIRVIVTVRDDFLVRIIETTESRSALSHMMVLRSPDANMLRAALTKPLKPLGFGFDDPTLVDEMIEQAGGELASLPLLQFAAQQLWMRRDSETKLLLRSAYEKVGGVAGALAGHADGLVDGLSPAARRLARQILLRMVTAQGTRAVVEQQQLLDELGEQAAEVLDALIAGRLLTLRARRGAQDNHTTAELELAHESLVSSWKTLAHWLDESRGEVAFISEVRQAAELWSKRGKRPHELWQEDALAEALRSAARCTSPIPAQVRLFLDAACARQKRTQTRTRVAVAAVLVLLAAAAVTFAVQKQDADEQRNEAQRQKGEAQRERGRTAQQQAAALREGARAALGNGLLLEARAKLRLALEIEDNESARALWWQLTSDPLEWSVQLGGIAYAVDISPDGHTLAVAGGDRTVYLLDTRTRATRVLRGHRAQILSISFSPNGQQLAAGAWTGEIRLWDVASGRQQKLLKQHQGAVTAISFSPDGKSLASAGFDRKVHIWNVVTGSLALVLKGHGGEIYGLSYNPAGDLLASGSADTTIRLWKPTLGAEQKARVLKGHSATVRTVSFSRDGRSLASGGVDRDLRIWNVETGATTWVLSGHHTEAVRSLSFGANSQWLASAGFDGSVRLWDVRTGTHVKRLSQHAGAVYGVKFGPTGRRLASVGFHGVVRLQKVTLADRTELLRGHAGLVNSVAFSPDGRLLVSGSADKTMRLWDVASGATKKVFAGHTRAINAVRFSPDGRLLASASYGKLRLWDVATGGSKWILNANDTWTVSFSPDGKLLASAGRDTHVRLWNVARGTNEGVLEGHEAGVWTTQFSPDGRLLVSGGMDTSVRVWNVASGATQQVLKTHRAAVRSVDFGDQGRRMVTGSWDRSARLWSIDRAGVATAIASPFLHPEPVWSTAIHPDGRRVGTACADGLARIWNPETNEVALLRGHNDEANSIAFSPDGTLTATASDDGTVRVWRTGAATPHWRSPALLVDRQRLAAPRLLSHRGWASLGTSPKTERPPSFIGPALRGALVQRARFASQQPRTAAHLCVQTISNTVELWDVAADQLVARHSSESLEQVIATLTGCLIRSAGKVKVLHRSGKRYELPLPGKASAIGQSHGATTAGSAAALIAAADQLMVFESLDGAARTPSARHTVAPGATAVGRIDGRAVAGYRDGNMEFVATAPAKAASFLFENVPSSPVLRIVEGPMHTLFAGYANGVVGMWSWKDGKRLAHAQLHGPVVHMLLRDDKLFVATDLGAHLTWDLSSFYRTHCEVLREVWQRVPVTWQQGHPTLQEPPQRHRCKL